MEKSNEKVKIISTVKHKVFVNIPELRFSRTWMSAGAVVSVDRSLLEDMMYDIGFKNMINMGMLYIEDMEVKKELGIEPEDATEPVNVIVLSDRDKNYYLTELSFVGFKDKVSKLGRTQLDELCDYAIEHRLLNVQKCKVLKEACGRDVINAVRLSELNEEE